MHSRKKWKGRGRREQTTPGESTSSDPLLLGTEVRKQDVVWAAPKEGCASPLKVKSSL